MNILVNSSRTTVIISETVTPGFRVPSSSTIISETTTVTNAGGSETGRTIDSYTWRKYGMKQVKSPEGSRSYYKCTYSACDAKKIESCDRFSVTVKRVYKGQHKHDPPKRVVSKKCDISFTPKSLKRKSFATSLIQAERIKEKNCSVLKSPKKPKLIVHAAADVEMSADGYRWKKYGQKIVKGSPHPRNYYRCTSAGCTVRKHIEKVVDGSSEVIITYKGVHDHDMPVPKKGQGPPTTLTSNSASTNIIQYKRREHLSTKLSINEAVRTNESARARTLLSVGFEINNC
ncbi:putative WRKY transcription factor 32 [Bidens hawaiensis]|uniref:putative WRKY transcription factor 32 n=1 Tax=Bidens hawaiensis TaxID=980011 RepID=UPI00404AD3BE